MPRDDEIRKVAEDIRALARSLARDFREAVDQSRAGGNRPGDAVRHGLKGVAEEAKRGVKDTWADLGPFSGPCGAGKHWQREWARHNRYRSRYANRYWFPPAPSPGVPGSPPGEPADGVEGGLAGAGGSGLDGPGGSAFGPPGSGPSVPAPPSWGRHPQWQSHRQARRSSLPPVRRRWDGTTVFGMLAVLFGVASLLSALHAIHVSTEGVVAVGLMLLGAAMIVTGRTDWSLSRRSWPVWLGLGLIVVLIATSSTFGVGSGVRNISFGDKTVLVSHPGQQVNGGFGTLTVDAAHLTNGGHVTVTNVAGNVRIINLPSHFQTNLDAKMAAGQICANGRHQSDGVGASTHLQIPASDPGAPLGTLTLDVHESFGQITVGKPGCAR
ncbi:MAG TPA: hypothetical protein VMO88_03015 [Acidimicrobiales bacterium]|nr:hypothetical protein [Acidimicrobiales bacterium]